MVHMRGMRLPLVLSFAALVACTSAKGASSGPAPSPVPSASAAIVAPSAEPSASVAEPVPSLDPAPSASAAPAEKPRLATRSLQSWIYEKPQRTSAHIGALRVRARVARSAEPVAVPGCNGPSTHWYAIEPRGFVCVGMEGVTLDVADPAVDLASHYPPKTGDAFPYGYGTSFGTPLYARIPTADEQRSLEGDVAGHEAEMAKLRAKLSEKKRWPELVFPPTDMPTALADHGESPLVIDPRTDVRVPPTALVAGRGWPDMRLSFLTSFDVDGRVFYLTTEHFIVPYDRIRPAKPPYEFHGVELAKAGETGEHLPIAWVNWKPATVYVFDDVKKLVKPTEQTLDVQAHVAIKEQPLVFGGVKYHELVSPPEGAADPEARYVVKDGPALRMDAATELPEGVGAEEAWIDIGISAQTLVMYKGLEPFYATLVSTGVDGAQDPEKTKSTPRGLFRIRSKFITARMAAEEKPAATEEGKADPRYRVDDVPYVQYFHAGYALHGAYWHDGFGQPRSHGCVNLAPRDAHYIFEHTAPNVPDAWHGVVGGVAGNESGTWIHIRNY
jgi:hypothetical protein